MPRLFVGNFDFEHRLAITGTLPRRLEQINAELSPVWSAIAEPGDAVWTLLPIDATIFDRLADHGLPRVKVVSEPRLLRSSHRLVFWGENDWARSIAQQWGYAWNGCDPAVVRRVNSRRFKFELERRFDVLPAGAAIVENSESLETATKRNAGVRAWVLKGEFGGAGREVRFTGTTLSSHDQAWASNRFDRGLAVTFEPRLERFDEAGIQYHVEQNGEVEFLGVTPLLTRANGDYLGNRFAEESALLVDWKEAIEVGRRTAQAVAAEGYWGPIGIDAMRYRDAEGTARMRPLQDLNARYTMGRLALELRRFPDSAEKLGWMFTPF